MQRAARPPPRPRLARRRRRGILACLAEAERGLCDGYGSRRLGRGHGAARGDQRHQQHGAHEVARVGGQPVLDELPGRGLALVHLRGGAARWRCARGRGFVTSCRASPCSTGTDVRP